MCNKTELVPIPDFMLSDYAEVFESGEYGLGREFDVDEQHRQCFALDACIIPAVVSLWQQGIVTLGCCCGHGTGHGVISVATDGDGPLKRIAQTRYFYEQVSKHNAWPAHNFAPTVKPKERKK